jgi:hypothetical protein
VTGYLRTSEHHLQFATVSNRPYPARVSPGPWFRKATFRNSPDLNVAFLNLSVRTRAREEVEVVASLVVLTSPCIEHA